MQGSKYPSQCLFPYHTMPCIYCPPSLSVSAYMGLGAKTLRLAGCLTLCPNQGKPSISPSLEHDSFLVWHEKGIVSFKDLYIIDTFASFHQLKAKFDLPKLHFLRFLQVRDWTNFQTYFQEYTPHQFVTDMAYFIQSCTQTALV